jgi:RNA-binding motif X-linked protein 2
VNLVRDKETGKSKGFAFLKYEDQRSTDLAVDNLGGTKIMNRVLRVDHTRYKKKDDDSEESQRLENSKLYSRSMDHQSDKNQKGEVARPMLKEERELLALMQEHDDDDPMKEFLIREKKDEVAMALSRSQDTNRIAKDTRRRHHHHHHHHHHSHRSQSPERKHRRSHRDKNSDEMPSSNIQTSQSRTKRENLDVRQKYHSRHED